MKKHFSACGLAVLETKFEPLLRHFIGFSFLLLSFVVVGSFPLCYFKLAQNEEPLIWYENKSDIALPVNYESQLAKELIRLGYNSNTPIKEGSEISPKAGQTQFFFGDIKDMPKNKRVSMQKDLQGEAFYTQRKIQIYLDRFKNMGGELDDLTDLSLHEIGHAVGNLEHSDDPNNLMYKYLKYGRSKKRHLNENQIMRTRSELEVH